ncbi:NADH-quinone oxidoreductase subunit NuoF [bacterium]|nr:NADH-quinone oxidoreductase subunit NuoF [bacterium]
MKEKFLLKGMEEKNSYKIDVYFKTGGYQSLKKALKLLPQNIIEEVKKSCLLGRGGAGFPTGKKWELTAQQKFFPKYVIANADESEPGTFKDRVLLEKNPHLVIEGLIIAGYAIGAKEGFIFIRGEFFNAYQILKEALEESRRYNLLGENILNSGFNFDIKIYQGAGAYMSGEETALLESMEGKRAHARGKPPYPAQFGFLGKPTLVNNVETLANIPLIIEKGGDWYSKIGTKESTGIKLFALSGNIKKPGVYELPLGVSLRELIEKYGGGVEGKFKCALPGGISSAFVTDMDINLDYVSLRKAGSMLGAGAVIVFNEDVDILEICLNILEFFYEESCGFCVPCRQGTKKAKIMLENIINGEGSLKDLEKLKQLKEVMFLTSNCGLGQSALCALVSAIEKFEDDFLKRIKNERRKSC